MTEKLTEKILMKKSPQELTSMLYKSCIEKLKESIIFIKEKNYEEANKNLQRCNDIIYRLGAGLKYEVGTIADQLDNLYNYMAEELIEANIKKDNKHIENVLKIIEEISESWEIAISKNTDKAAVNKNVLKYQENLIQNSNDNRDSFEYKK